jgi:hypothetical protein
MMPGHLIDEVLSDKPPHSLPHLSRSRNLEERGKVAPSTYMCSKCDSHAPCRDSHEYCIVHSFALFNKEKGSTHTSPVTRQFALFSAHFDFQSDHCLDQQLLVVSFAHQNMMNCHRMRVMVFVSFAVAVVIGAVVIVFVAQKGSAHKDVNISHANEDQSTPIPSIMSSPTTTIIPSPMPTSMPSLQSVVPSMPESPSPEIMPLVSLTSEPSVGLSHQPSSLPSITPPSTTNEPTSHLNQSGSLLTSRSLSPSACPTAVATELVTIFYAIGDVPYTPKEREQLPGQIASLPADAEFLVHVGDIRSAKNFDRCRRAQYVKVANMLLASRVPVFIIVGGTYRRG